VLQQYPGTNFLQEAGKARSNKPEHLSMLEEKGQPEQGPVVHNILEQCDQSCHRVGRLAEKEQQGLRKNNDLCLGHQKAVLCLYMWCDLDHDILPHDSWEPE
jgi:hypothetical protein